MTQFIGLSSSAKDFLNSTKAIKLCEYHMTEGMFDEPIKGDIYECTLQTEGRYSVPGNEYLEEYKETFVEVVQASPWSSGPVIFTCLENIRTKERIGLWSEEAIESA